MHKIDRRHIAMLVLPFVLAACSPIMAVAQVPDSAGAYFSQVEPEAYAAVIVGVVDFFMGDTDRLRTGPCTAIGRCAGELRRSPGQDLTAMVESGTVAVAVVPDRTFGHFFRRQDYSERAWQALTAALEVLPPQRLTFVPAEAIRIPSGTVPPMAGMRYVDPESGALHAECRTRYDPREERRTYACDLHGETELVMLVSYPVAFHVDGRSDVALTVYLYRQVESGRDRSDEMYVQSLRLHQEGGAGWVPYREHLPVSLNPGR